MSTHFVPRRLLTLGAAVAATALIASGLVLPAASAAADAPINSLKDVDCSSLALGQPCTMSYQKDIMYLRFSIPVSVTEITFVLSGASGGGDHKQHTGAGGPGGVVIGAMAINSSTTDGHKLYAMLGQSGQGVTHGATDGWGAGAQAGVGSDTTGGWGGGSSALLSGVNLDDPTDVTPIAAAGGGGGGGSFGRNLPAFGGAGGAGGKPAQDGADGSGDGTWGPGGKGGGAQFEIGERGGQDNQGFSATGGGGGGGGAHHGGKGGSEGGSIAAAGGGGGGDSAANTAVVDSPVFNSGHLGDGQLTIYPGRGEREECINSNERRQLTVPPGTAAFAFVAVGGSGEHGSNEYPHDGTGGVASGVLNVTGMQSLDYFVGCSGYSHNGAGFGRPGAGGDAPGGGNDGGRGGGASAILLHNSGVVLVAAGGGGGQGGDTTSCGGVYRDECGGPGGNSAGRPGTRLPASGTDGGGGDNGGSGPGGDGGCANCEGGKHPNPDGGDGVSPDARFTGAGGGGGAGYPAGGRGGHHSVGEAGGGGGSGGSYLSHSYVTDGSLAPRGINGDGFILFIRIPEQTTALTIEKVVTGDAASHATAPFGVSLFCHVGDAVTMRASFQVAAGGSHHINVRRDSTCTVTETGTGGASTPAPPRTVVLSAPTETVTLTNKFEVGSLDLRVFSVVVGEGGSANPGVAFDVPDVTLDVACTLDGRPIALPAPVSGGQVAFDGAATQTEEGADATIPDLPIGAECDVTRTAGGVSTPEYSIDGGAASSTPAHVTLTAGGNAVHVGDRYLLVPLHIALQAAGNGTPPTGAAYAGTVACTIDGAPVTLVSDAFAVTVGATTIVHSVPVGAVCSLENIDPGTAVATSYAPSRTITIAADSEITITAAYDNGALLVAVSASGSGAGWANVAPAIAVQCTSGGLPVLDETFTPATGTSGWASYAVPAGAVCTASQGDAAGATSVLYSSNSTPTPGTSPVQVTIPDGAGATLLVDDVFTAAPLRIVATESGAGAAFALPPTAHVSECTFNGLPIEPIAGADSVDLPLPSDGGAVRLAALPTGSSCQLSESDTGGATTVAASQERGTPSTDIGPGVIRITMQNGGTAQPTTVLFDNAFDVGTLGVTMSVVGAGTWAATKPYAVDVTCQFAGAPLTTIGPGGVTSLTFTPQGALVEDAAAQVLDALPMGTSCSAAETDAAGATTVTYSPAGSASASGTVVVALGAPPIVITNEFDTTTLSITPTLTGTDAAAHVDDEFWFDVGCTFQGGLLGPPPTDPTRSNVFALTPGATEQLADLPVGAECSAEQTVDHHATQVSPSRVQTATLAAAPSQLAWVNAFDSSSVVVTETLSGDGVADYATGITFSAKVTCTYADGSDDADLPNDGFVPLSAGNGYVGSLLAPVGATCSVNQASVPATRVQLSDPIIVALGSPLSLTIESTFALARVTVAVTASGTVPEHAAFGFTVTCSYRDQAMPFVAADDGRFRLSVGSSHDLRTLAGTACTATESDTGGAAATTVTVTGHPPASGATARFLSVTTATTVAFDNAFGWLALSGADPTATLTMAAALLLIGLLLALLAIRRRRSAVR